MKYRYLGYSGLLMSRDDSDVVSMLITYGGYRI